MKKANKNNSPYKGFSQINNILPSVAKSHKLESALHNYKIRQQWETVVCSFLNNAKGLTKAINLKDGVLTVACLSKDVAYEIKLIAHRIIYALNQTLSKNLVFAIRVEV